MGWDAIAMYADGSEIERFYGWEKGYDKRRQIGDKALNKAFRKASKEVADKAGCVDGLLCRAALDCRTCAEMLEQATGEGMWRDEDATAEEVKCWSKEANWDFEYDENDAWAYWSARRFLELCAEHGLAINFSW